MARGYTIQLMKLANGQDNPLEGEWVVGFDPGPKGSRGVISTTREENLAKPFPNHGEAWKFWMQEHGFRPDGKPNRPLTIWSVVIEPLEENLDDETVDVDGVRSSEGLS